MNCEQTNSCARRHIARLQEQNRLLAECLAEERKKRKEAYAWYQKRLRSKFYSVLDLMALQLSDMKIK